MNSKRYAIGYMTIVGYEWRSSFKQIHRALLVPLVNLALYLLVFGHIIGSQLDDIKGVSYLQYIATGLLLNAVFTCCYQHVTGTVFSMKLVHSFDEFFISPLPYWLIAFSFITAGMLSGCMISLPVFVAILWLMQWQVHNLWLLVGLIVSTGFVFSLVALINALVAKEYRDISIIENMTLTPLLFFSGIYYDINQVSPLIQSITRLNPFYYLASAYHHAVLGFDWNMSWLSLFLLCLLFLLTLYAAALLIEKHKNVRI